MNDRRLGAAAGLLGVLAIALRNGSRFVVGGWDARGVPAWVPPVGSTGQTVWAYSTLVDLAAPLLTITFAVALGYYAAQSRDVRRGYQQFFRVTLAGSAAGVIVVWTSVVLLSVSSTSTDAVTVFVVLVMVAEQVVTVALVITLGAFAGLAFAHFAAGGGPPPLSESTPDQPTPDDDSTETEPQRDTPSEPSPTDAPPRF